MAINYVSTAITDITNLLNNEPDSKKQLLIAKWLSKYSKYLNQEKTFSPRYLKRYLRGEIIMVDFGYRIGNEEGGPHYAIVLDKNNSISSGIITVMPLSSKKASKNTNKYTIDLGTEIYDALTAKANKAFADTLQVKQLTHSSTSNHASATVQLSFSNNRFQKIRDEINLMKTGSIALVSQITTISKMRIIKPKRTTDPLSGIRLSDATLDLIDDKIIKLYTGYSDHK